MTLSWSYTNLRITPTTSAVHKPASLPDCEEEIGANQLVPLCLPLALLPCLLVCPASQEMLENVTASQHGVAGHMVHPPNQSLPALGDEVLLEAAGGLLFWQVGH